MGKFNPTPDSGAVRRFMIFLALVFLAQGLGQVGGVVNQPLIYYLKEALHWQPDQVTRYVAFLIIPWIIKPLYGFLSDKVPLFGYRRKPYVLLANLLASLGFARMTGLTSAFSILAALFLTAFGMAAASTITEAALVENGNRWGMAGRFLNQQWLWFNLSAIGSALLGGWLAQNLAPAGAFHTAAIIAACAPAIIVISCWFLLDEKPGMLVRTTGGDSHPEAQGIFSNKTLWLTGFFLFVWNIVPSFGTPLFYHMVDNLHFDQRFIGILSAVASVGSVAGAGLYALLARKLTLKQLLYVSIVLGAVSQLSYIWMNGAVSAVIINVFGGVIGMVALVSSLTVAAHVVPDKSAGFAFAVLMSVNNLSGQLASNIGAWLFVHVFHNQLNPLIIVAAVGTAACWLLVPMLKLGDQRGDSFARRKPVTPIHPAVTLVHLR